MLRTLRLLFEIIAALIGIIIVCSLLLIWRLNSGPVRSEVLTPYIKSGIERLVPGSHTKIANSLMTWDEDTHSVAIHLDGINVTGPDGTMIAELPSMGIRLNVFGVVLGQFLPSELIVDHLQIWLTRTKNGSFAFGGVSQSVPSTNNDLTNFLEGAVHNLARAYITNKLFITRGVIAVHDNVTNSDWSIHVPEINLQRAPQGLTGFAKIEVAQKDEFSTLTINYNYNRERELHTFRTRLSGINPSFFVGGHPSTLGLGSMSIIDMPLTGDVALTIDNRLSIQGATVKLHSDNGQINYSNFWAEPVSIKSFDISLDYDRINRKLYIPVASIDFYGPKVSMAMKGVPLESSPSNIDYALTIKMDDWPIEQYVKLWPKPVIADANDWIKQNIHKGRFDHAEANFKGSIDVNNLAGIVIKDGNGKITASNAEVGYIDTMPPLENVNCEATFDLKKMSILMTTGNIGNLKIAPSTVIISGLQDDTQFIDIPIDVSGPIPELMTLIDHPPLNFITAMGLKTDDIEGSFSGIAQLHFPLLNTLRMDDIEVKANAQLLKTSSSKLFRDYKIDQGFLTLDLNKDGFTLKGPVNINTIPLHAVWIQNFHLNNNNPIFKSTLTGPVNGEQWEALGLTTLKGSHGPSELLLNLTQVNKDKLLIDGTVDMGPAEIKLGIFNWYKPANTPALLKFSAEYPSTGDIIIKSIEMNGPGVNVKGKAELSHDENKLVSLSLKPLIIGRSNAELVMAKAERDDDVLNFIAEGESLDVSGLRGGKDEDGKDQRPREYQFKLKKLYTSDQGFIANVEGYARREGKNWDEISLSGLTDGNHQLKIELQPQGNHRIFSLTSDDFGKTLKGMGFTNSVYDGNLEVHAASTDEQPHVLIGEIKISHFVVRKLPVLALLLNATSPFGIIGIVTDSVDFDGIKGKFYWLDDRIIFKRLKASGTAIDINIDGPIDMNTGNSGLHGAIVPFGMFNHVLSYIPLLGDIITGGEGSGVFAVSYKISGSLEEPNIMVNPMSLLTPGFLRELVFDNNDDSEIDDKGDIKEDNAREKAGSTKTPLSHSNVDR